MAISMFDTRTMLPAIEYMKPPTMFFRDTFFGGSQTSNTRYIDVDIVRGGRELAPFSDPALMAHQMDKFGFKTNTYKAPYLKVKKVTNASQLLERQAGQHIYAGNQTPSARAEAELRSDLEELQNAVRRREEWMCAQALNGGVINVVGEGVNDTITYGMPAGHIATVGTLWSNSSAKPLKDLRDYSRTITKASGIRPDVAVIGEDVIENFLDRIKGDYLPVDVAMDRGMISPAQVDMQGVTYWGRLKDPAIDLYSYDAWYNGDNYAGETAATQYQLMPAKKVFLGSRSARTRNTFHYGAIEDLDVTASVPYFPKSWVENDPSARVIMLQSAPLPGMHQPDTFAVLTVLS